MSIPPNTIINIIMRLIILLDLEEMKTPAPASQQAFLAEADKKILDK